MFVTLKSKPRFTFQSKSRIKHLEDSHKDINSSIETYNKLFAGDKDVTEPNITHLLNDKDTFSNTAVSIVLRIG